MHINGTEVVRWLESLPPDTVVYKEGDASSSCVITTYAKTVDSRVVSSAPNYGRDYGEAYGHVYQNTNDYPDKAIGTVSIRVVKMMRLFDSQHRGRLTAGEALELIRKEGI